MSISMECHFLLIGGPLSVLKSMFITSNIDNYLDGPKDGGGRGGEFQILNIDGAENTF